MTKGQVAKNQQDERRPALVEDYADKYAGEETHVDREHTITPRATILQGLSPQVKRNNVAYVDGAVPGMIFLSSYYAPLIDGDEGILFQPCLFQTMWEVRTPKESGAQNYIDAFPDIQKGWEPRRAEKGFAYYITPERNVASQIHIHIGLIHLGTERLPYAIPFRGTGMFISKQFNGLVGSRRTDSGKPAARFTYTYRMVVKSQANAMGEWGQWHISPEGKASNEDQDLAHELVEGFKKGERTVEREVPGEFADEGEGAM
jgi:hypothetical protein